MSLEARLASVPVDQWRTKQAIVFDWYDGPRQGVCCLVTPAVEFYFELLDERPTQDDLDDRLFRLSEIAPGSVEGLLSVLSSLESPNNPIWVPVWRFPNAMVRQQAEQYLERVRADARPTTVVVCTRDMIHFLGCWNADRTDHDVADWFAHLNIPQEPAAR